MLNDKFHCTLLFKKKKKKLVIENIQHDENIQGNSCFSLFFLFLKIDDFVKLKYKDIKRRIKNAVFI